MTFTMRRGHENGDGLRPDRTEEQLDPAITAITRRSLDSLHLATSN